MRNLLKNITTVKDGVTFCPVRLMMLISFGSITLCMLGGFILECLNFYHGIFLANGAPPAPPHFDSVSYGTAVSGLSLAGPAGILLKQKDEPNAAS
jgi:hypothetical protein